MHTLGIGEMFLLFISVVMVVFFIFLMLIQPNREHRNAEIYHNVTTKMGDRVYSETKVFKGSFTYETQVDQSFLNATKHILNSSSVALADNSCILSEAQIYKPSRTPQQIYYENNLHGAAETNN